MNGEKLSKPKLLVLHLTWLFLALVLAAVVGSSSLAAPALGTTYYVCPAGPPTCDYASIQAVVDAAVDGDTIKVAQGTYAGVQARPAPAGYPGPASLLQSLYLTKTVTIEGGFTTTDWTTPDPAAHPTTLDAQGQGRVLFIAGEIAPVIEGLRLAGGDASDLGGTWSTDAGGGIYVVTATATISDCLIYENLAGSSAWGGAGGGMYLASSSSTVLNSTIRDNAASTSGEGYGGGLALHASNASIENSEIYDNVASSGDWGFGGGVDLYASDATLSGNEIFGNTASSADEGYGGGLHLDGGNVTLTSNTIRDNTASTDHGGYGGGLSLSEAGADVRGNIIMGNTGSASASSYGYGGGVDLWESDANLSRNVIRANVASVGNWGYGGGLSLAGSGSRLVNNAVIDNEAGGNGAGFHIEGGTPTLIHTTIARNTGGDGSGLYLNQNSAVTLTNTILASQTVGIAVGVGNSATLNGVLWHGNTSDSAGGGTINVANATTGDPAFAADGYHLLANSAALDAGIDAEVSVDIDDEPRPNRIPDLGADEHWPWGPASSYVYLPLVAHGYR